MNQPKLAACLVLAVCSAPSLVAQSLPRYSVELTGGAGARTSQVGSVWYFGDRDNSVRGALTVRIGSLGRIRPVVTADYGFALRGDQLSICGRAPNGSCIQYFPEINGLSAGVGVRAALHSRITLGSSLGLSSIGTRARFADADLAIAMTRRLSAVVHWRRLTWSGADGNLWFQPLSFGIRVQPSPP